MYLFLYLIRTMAGVDGIRAQFENPNPSSSFQPSPRLRRSPVTKQKGTTSGSSSPPSRLSKAVIANIGKSISQPSPTETKKVKPTKQKSTEETVKQKGGNDKAMAALAGVIRSASNSPRAPNGVFRWLFIEQ